MRKPIIATLALGTVLTLGAVGVASALPTIAGAQSAATTQGHGKHPAARALLRHEFTVAADTIGVTPAELRTDVKNGQSIAEVATSKNVPVGDVVTDVVNDATAKIDQAVTNGKIDQARATTFESQLTDRVTKLVNAHRGDFKGQAQGN